MKTTMRGDPDKRGFLFINVKEGKSPIKNIKWFKVVQAEDATQAREIGQQKYESGEESDKLEEKEAA
jgi:hypothetical protein